MPSPEFIEELRSLACLASMRSGVTFSPGTPDSSWCFNWETNVITAKAGDLELRPSDYCRGLVLHEAAHAAVTRLHGIVPHAEYRDHNVRHLLNAIEDCRIETWLQHRLPGSRAWIRLFNDHTYASLTPEEHESVAAHLPVSFCCGIISRWWSGTLPPLTSPRVVEALDRVWPHCLTAIHAQPPAEPPPEHETRERYAAHPVSHGFLGADFDQNPDAMEMAIRMSQHTMWSIVWRHILPEFRRLIEESGQQMPPHGQCGVSVVSGRGPKSGQRPPSAEEQARDAASDDPYMQTRAQVAGLIEPLSETLLRHLIAENRTRWRRHLPGGQRLDLRVAMQFEADPRLHDRLWMRRTLPHRPDPAFLALVDVSGSMQGQKAEATFASLVLLREVCLRCGIPLTVIAFGCGARILQHPHAPDNADTRRNLHCVLQAEAPHTDMHEGLKLAARELSRCPCAHRYLWLFSDGVPDDEAATRTALARIRQDITSLIALGLGPGTEPLAGLIPGAQVNLTAAQLPRVVARLFETEVLAA